MEITEEQLERLAQMAHLRLNDPEREKILKQLAETLEYIKILKELDPEIESLAETASVSGLKNVYREDEVLPDRILTQSQILKNAQKSDRGFFVVPKVI